MGYSDPNQPMWAAALYDPTESVELHRTSVLLLAAPLRDAVECVRPGPDAVLHVVASLGKFGVFCNASFSTGRRGGEVGRLACDTQNNRLQEMEQLEQKWIQSESASSKEEGPVGSCMEHDRRPMCGEAGVILANQKLQSSL